MGKMHFDVVLGNPPYQEEDGGAAASAQPVYQHFVEAVKKLNPDCIELITPSRWFVGGKGLDKFRTDMLNDKHIQALHDYLTPQDVFPHTNIRGGVSYFIWNKHYDNEKQGTHVVTHKHQQIIADVKRPWRLEGTDIFVRDSIGANLVMKLTPELQRDNFSLHMSARKPFGLSTTFDRTADFHANPKELVEPLKCYAKGGKIGYVERSKIKTHTEWIDHWKVLTAESNNIGTELPDDNLNTLLCEPQAICTETYILMGKDLPLTLEAAKRLQKYARTKFLRFLHGLAKGSQHATAKTYRFVPMVDFFSNDVIDWRASVPELNRRLYQIFHITEEEAQHIDVTIKEMA